MVCRDPCLKQGIQLQWFVSWTGYLFPWLSSRVLLSRVAWACACQNIKYVSEHGVVFKALYWPLRPSLEQGPKSRRIVLNRVSYFPAYSLKQGQGFTVPATPPPPHSITYRVPPPPLNNLQSAPPPPPQGNTFPFGDVSMITLCNVTGEIYLIPNQTNKI